MSQIDIHFSINESILLALKESKEELIKEMLYNNALHLYKKNKLSLGKAAEMSGYSRLDFIDKLRLENEVIFANDEELLLKAFADKEKAIQLIENKNK